MISSIFKGTAASVACTALLTLAGCGSNDVYLPGDNPDGPEVNGEMIDFFAAGFVLSPDGRPLDGVEVSSGSVSAVSDAAGYFELRSAERVDERTLFSFSKGGYFTLQRTVALTAGRDADQLMRVVLQPAVAGPNVAVSSFSASSPERITAGGFSVDLPAGGFVRAESGEAYSGTVNVAVMHLSPDNPSFGEMMPGGDLAGVDTDGSPLQLISYGMADVSMTASDGSRLQLASGASADVSFRVPESLASSAPAEIPLWSYDERTGLWQRELSATRGADGSYTGQASHFSWINLDDATPPSWLVCHVTDTDDRPLENIEVLADWHRLHTNAAGECRTQVASNTIFTVTVPPETYGDYTPVYKNKNVLVGAGMEFHLYIKLPVHRRLYGRVVDADGEPVPVNYTLTAGSFQSQMLSSNAEGRFVTYLPWNYAGEGTVSIITGDGKTKDETFDIPGDEDVYLTITLDGSVVPPGTPDITVDYRGEDTRYLEVISPLPSQFGGVVVENSTLVASSSFSDEDPDRSFWLIVNDYSPEISEYYNATLYATDRTKVVRCVSDTVMIRRDNDTFYFQLKGRGEYANTATGQYHPDALIQVHNVPMLHLMTLETAVDYTPAYPVPDFTPLLPGTVPVASLCTESSRLGTGAFLYYNGSRSDYDNLCRQAAGSGFDLLGSDTDTDYCDAMYSKDKAAILVEYDGLAPRITGADWAGKNILFNFQIGSENDDYDDLESQVAVTAFTGGILSIADIMGDAGSGFSAPRLRKVSRRLSRPLRR